MHKLIPFENLQQTPQFQVSASIQREAGNSGLVLEFLVEGLIKNLHLPALSNTNTRADNLWQSTCFEAFLSVQPTSDSPYLEINLTPDGRWNLYHLTSYRQNLSPVPTIQPPLIQVEESELQYKLKATWKRLPRDLFESPLHVGLTVILESKLGEKTYWALAHKSPQADFHNKESFTVIV